MKRKWKVLCAGLLCTVTLTIGAQGLYAQDVPEDVMKLAEATETTADQESSYAVTIDFDKNGGSGSMSGMTVTNDQTNATLTPNRFKRKNYEFAGWSTTANGSVEYENKANAVSLATEENNGQTITLYAQWKLAAPTIKKMTSRPSEITVRYSKNPEASGYEIMYSASKKFPENKKSTATTTVTNKKTTSAELLHVIPNKKYYVKVRSYKKKSGTTIYSDWSKVREHKVKNGKTLMNTKAEYGIEADVKMTGSGSGYHSKLVIGTPASAVSFGMQYDVGAAIPYGARNMALIENVASNAAGDQQYIRPGNVEFKLDKYYHLMITIDKKGNGNVYVDYNKIGSFKQPNLRKGSIFLWLEASGRLNGDGVDSEFKNVKYTDASSGVSVIGEDKNYNTCRHDKTNAGLKCKYTKKTNTIRMYGKIRNLSGDWDSAYNGVSYRLHIK